MLIMLILISIWIACGIIFREKIGSRNMDAFFSIGFIINFIFFYMLVIISNQNFLEIESSKTYNLSLINNSFFVRASTKDGIVKYSYAYVDDDSYLHTKEVDKCKIVKDILPTVTIMSWKSSLGWWGFGTLKHDTYVINVPLNTLSNIEILNKTAE